MHGRLIFLLLCCSLVAAAACDVEAVSQPVADGAAHTALEQSVVDGCLACHRGALSLEDKSVEDLVAAITQMSRGELDHVVPVPELSEEDVGALARALAGEDE